MAAQQEPQDITRQATGNKRETWNEFRFSALVGLFALAELGTVSAVTLWFAAQASLITIASVIVAAALSLSFLAAIVLATHPHDADADCWEALHQALTAWRRAVREQGGE